MDPLSLAYAIFSSRPVIVSSLRDDKLLSFSCVRTLWYLLVCSVGFLQNSVSAHDVRVYDSFALWSRVW